MASHMKPLFRKMDENTLMQPKGDCIWMIGDNPVNDIQGARENINAVTLQKMHAGVELGTDASAPDATFYEFAALRKLIAKLGGQR